ncbi:hypothetical protein Nmel_006821 [Mimus melanotis]
MPRQRELAPPGTENTAPQRESCREDSAGSRLAAVMRRSKTVIAPCRLFSMIRQIASHMISYAPHAQEHMKNHFTMIARVYILTSEFILNLTAVKLCGLVVFICCLGFGVHMVWH